ncbi:Saposin B-type domain-containing protein [Caenorhabditis elegans]|uniref:Saposin B-type domain-containing protein n=2 Tax=Caenorhabditis elegans TaxID=6239 RepID=Q2XMZ1_CAEEL|nr:Saposin B-type domain-containing protein [Caenorhabditis elegans]CAJ43904.2 Saposin B-type domain-containing protein [Caenorhabditis elegans]|eukprot:NP_001122464.1 Uncharacterized protein CELE_F30A10.13 [Caenorhabditis elegans]
MRILLYIFLFTVFFHETLAQQHIACVFCNKLFNMPQTWEKAQNALNLAGCSNLGGAKKACNGIVNNANLTESFPNMLPHNVQLKDLACKKYCKEQ